METNINIQILEITKNIVNSLNGIPFGVALLILKDIYNEIEKKYSIYLEELYNNDDLKENTEKTKKIEIPIEELEKTFEEEEEE